MENATVQNTLRRLGLPGTISKRDQRLHDALNNNRLTAAEIEAFAVWYDSPDERGGRTREANPFRIRHGAPVGFALRTKGAV